MATGIFDIIVIAIGRNAPSNFVNDLTFYIIYIVTAVLFNTVFRGIAYGLEKNVKLFRLLFIAVMAFRVIDNVTGIVNVVAKQFGVMIPGLFGLLHPIPYYLVSRLLFGIPLVLMLVFLLLSKRLTSLSKLFVLVLLAADALKLVFYIPTGYTLGTALMVVSIIFDAGLVAWGVQMLAFPNIGKAPATGVTRAVEKQPAQQVEGMKPSTTPALAEPTGAIKGLPTLYYWCDKCNKTIGPRQINPKGLTKADFSKPQKCPTCGTTLKAFWLFMNQKLYIKLIVTISFFAGALWIANLTPVILDYMSVYAAGCALGGTIFCAVVAVIMMISLSKSRIKPTARPENATEIPSLAPMDSAGKEIFFLVLFIVIGSLAIFGIFWLIFFTF